MPFRHYQQLGEHHEQIRSKRTERKFVTSQELSFYLLPRQQAVHVIPLLEHSWKSLSWRQMFQSQSPFETSVLEGKTSLINVILLIMKHQHLHLKVDMFESSPKSGYV